MKKRVINNLLVMAFLFVSGVAFAQNKVVVIPLNSPLKAIINPKEIVTHHLVIGPSVIAELQIPADSTFILTDLIGTNHLAVTVQVNDVMKLDLTTFSDKKISMTSGIACPAGSTLKITNTTETVTAVTVSGYYY